MNKETKRALETFWPVIVLAIFFIGFFVWVNLDIQAEHREADVFQSILEAKNIQVFKGTRNADGTAFIISVESTTEFLELANNTQKVYRSGTTFYVFSSDFKLAYRWFPS